ncbi:MAG: hypothetical protein JWN61_3079 [Pseudonocardiales bacterium]|nr:hypothetical protein [Pseudonocardiales bacterium]
MDWPALFAPIVPAAGPKSGEEQPGLVACAAVLDPDAAGSGAQMQRGQMRRCGRNPVAERVASTGRCDPSAHTAA